jgi:23S rRNA pseudouridine955/2504/2580 synthase
MKRFKLTENIIFENEDFMAVNKPPHLSCLHDRSIRSNLLDIVRAYHEDAQLCHRIDKETSGLVLVAKNNDTYKKINRLFEKRTISKTYAALVHGRHFFENEHIDLSISTTSRGKARIGGKNAKYAETIVNTSEAFKSFSLVECNPITGRLHQIRVHLKAFRAPIVGDTIYGEGPSYLSDMKRNFNLKDDENERPLIGRTALHAWKVSFELDGAPYTLEADYPKDFSVALKLIRKYNAL